MIEDLRKWRKSPRAFVEQALGATPEQWQGEALDALVTHDRLAIAGGHGVGITTFQVWAVLWFLQTHFPCKVACTAPTEGLLEDIFWADMEMWHGKTKPEFRDLFEFREGPSGKRLERVSHRYEAFAIARPSGHDRPEAFQGLFSEHLLFVASEASSVDDLVFTVAEGFLASKGAKTILGGVPLCNEGYFHDALDSSNWWTRRVSCEEVGRVDPDYVRNVRDKYGTDSNFFRARVLGKSPIVQI